MTSNLQSARERTRTYEFLGLAIVLASALWIYRGAFLGFFVQDDFGWLFESRFRHATDYLHRFFRFNNALSYRPLSQETFFLVFQKLFGMWPPAYHGMSVFCHLLAAVLLYRLLRKFSSPLASLVGTLFFAAHSAHFRSVYWISAIPEPAALIFFLAALICFIRFDREGNRGFALLSILWMGLGMMCKESILSLPLVLAVYCVLFSRARLLWTVPHFTLSALYGLLRALSRSAVGTAPYKLTFGHEAWQNFLTYLSWTAGFSETLLKIKLKLEVPAVYPLFAAGAVLALILLVILARDKRIALFALLWYLAALQPVLYFEGHIFSYYLAPALPAIALLLACSLDSLSGFFAWKRWLLATVIAWFCLWSSYASVKREGRWWNERTFISRNILTKMQEVIARVPPERTAYLFGFGRSEFGAMQRDAAFRAYGISPWRFILVGLDARTHGQIEVLRRSGGIRDFYAFVYSRGAFVDWSKAFRDNPKPFLLIQPPDELERMARGAAGDSPIRLEVSSTEITAGADALTIRIRNLDAHSVDLLYTLDRGLMPAITGWRVDEEHKSTVFVAASTPRGDYHYRAIRNSDDPDLRHWYPVNIHVTVK